MKKILTLLLLASLVMSIQAQKSYSKIKVSGFDIQFAYTGGFSYSFEKNLPVNISEDGDILVIELDTNKHKSGIKPQLVLNADKLTYLALTECKWSYVGEGLANDAEIDLQRHTVVDILAGSLGNVKVTVGYTSELTIGGMFQTLKLDVNKGSNVTSTSLHADTLRLDIVSASKANMQIVAKRIEIVAKLASTVVLKGETEELNIVGNMAVNLNARDLKTQKAYVDTHRGCDITINAVEANRNPEVINIADLPEDTRKRSKKRK